MAFVCFSDKNEATANASGFLSVIVFSEDKYLNFLIIKHLDFYYKYFFCQKHKIEGDKSLLSAQETG